MRNAGAEFERQARREQAQIVAEAVEAHRAVSLTLYKALIGRAWDNGGQWGSPVASGRYVASMRVSLNALDTSTAPADPSYRYPSREQHGGNADALPKRTVRNPPISAVAATLRGFRLGDTIYVSNAVPYVRRIEIAGHSWQAPGGVFEPTTAKIVVQFRDLESALKVSSQ